MTTSTLADPPRLSPQAAYEKTGKQFNNVAADLARRLTQETQGDVLFSAADRGRYATDASIYQEMPVGGVCAKVRGRRCHCPRSLP